MSDDLERLLEQSDSKIERLEHDLERARQLQAGAEWQTAHVIGQRERAYRLLLNAQPFVSDATLREEILAFLVDHA